MPRKLRPYSTQHLRSHFPFYDSILDSSPSLTLNDAAIFSLLASLQQGRPCSSPSHAYLASRLRLSPSTVKRSLHTLESLQLLSVARFRTPDGRKHNSYTVNPQLALDLQDARPSLRTSQLALLRSKYPTNPPPKA